MRRLLGRLDDGTLVESVLVRVGSALQHRYRVVGGALDGQEFSSLFELGRQLGPFRSVVRPA